MDQAALAQVFRADGSSSDLSSGGALATEVAAEFLQYPLKRSVLLRECRTVDPMESPTQDFPKLIAPARTAQPGVEGQALPASGRYKFTFNNVRIETVEIVSEVQLTWNLLEDSVAQGRLKSILMTYGGRAFQRDLEDWFLNGDTTSGDALLALQDGMLRRFTTNTIAHGGGVPTKAMFSKAIRKVGAEWLDEPFRHYLGPHAVSQYRESIADRETQLGDRFFAGQEGINPTGAGYPVISTPLMPQDEGGSSNETRMITTRPDNMVLGFWKNVRVYMGSEARERKDWIVTRVRAGNNVEWAEAAVQTTGIKALDI